MKSSLYPLTKLALSFGTALISACIVSNAHAQVSFGGIGFTSFLNGLSPDGSALAGVYYPQKTFPNTTAFAWTKSTGIINLGLFPASDPGPYESYTNALAVTNNAAVVVGYGRTSSAMNEQAFKWTQQNGYQLLPTPAGALSSSAAALSADGSKIFGDNFSTSPFFHYDAAEWTSEGVGVLASAGYPNWVNDTSADGSVSVGRSGSAAYWNSSGVHSISGWNANAVSSDGQYLVGTSTGYPGSRAFRYNIAAGAYDYIPYLKSSDTYAVATDISGDGRIVVGYSGSEPFIWDQLHGTRSLDSVLQDLGLNDEGWRFYSNGVLKISDDGSTIAGNGIHENRNEIYIAQLSAGSAAVPEPSTYGIFGLLTLAVIGLRRSRRRASVRVGKIS